MTPKDREALREKLKAFGLIDSDCRPVRGEWRGSAYVLDGVELTCIAGVLSLQGFIFRWYLGKFFPWVLRPVACADQAEFLVALEHYKADLKDDAKLAADYEVCARGYNLGGFG